MLRLRNWRERPREGAWIMRSSLLCRYCSLQFANRKLQFTKCRHAHTQGMEKGVYRK